MKKPLFALAFAILLPNYAYSQVKSGLTLSMISARLYGESATNDSRLDGAGGAWVEFKKPSWGIRCTGQYYRQQGYLTEGVAVIAYKTSAEATIRKYFSDDADGKMQWYAGGGVHIPINIQRESINQERMDWGAVAEFGGMKGRWSGGFFFGFGLGDSLPDVPGTQNWGKWGIRADFAIFR